MNIEQIHQHAQESAHDRRELVVVMGLGFVGSAVLANLARTRDRDRPAFFVVGLETDTPAGQQKVRAVNEGRPPTYAEDSSLAAEFARAAQSPRTAVATVDPRVLTLADVVVCCMGLDLHRTAGQTAELSCDTTEYETAVRTVGRHIRRDTLVCIESTLPLGMCDRILYPALCAGQRDQGLDPEATPPLLAYCYERVMPGPDYLDSVNQYWRAFAGANPASADRAEAFLSRYVDIHRFPLWRHKSTRAAEMGKLLENAYRATNIAFIEEWAQLAEVAGVDLFDVIRSIRVRTGTHDNMMFPGLGVGGYCLTKDAMLAAFGAETLLDLPAPLPFSRLAIVTNEKMPLRAIELIEGHHGADLSGRRAILFGITYRVGVADTRNSPAAIIAHQLLDRGAEVVACDACVSSWPEVPEVTLTTPERGLTDADIVVLCLPDPTFATGLPPLLERLLAPGAVVVDAWNVVAEHVARNLEQRGIQLFVFGRGDLEPRRE